MSLSLILLLLIVVEVTYVISWIPTFVGMTGIFLFFKSREVVGGVSIDAFVDDGDGFLCIKKS